MKLSDLNVTGFPSGIESSSIAKQTTTVIVTMPFLAIRKFYACRAKLIKIFVLLFKTTVQTFEGFKAALLIVFA